MFLPFGNSCFQVVKLSRVLKGLQEKNKGLISAILLEIILEQLKKEQFKTFYLVPLILGTLSLCHPLSLLAGLITTLERMVNKFTLNFLMKL